MAKSALETLRKSWKKINLESLAARVNHSLQMPRCKFYDGARARERGDICPHWQNWLVSGRRFYDNLQDYLKSLKEQIPEGYMGLKHRRIRNFLKTHPTPSVLSRLCYNP